MKTTRSAQFAGIDYNFIAYDLESIKELPGLYEMSGIAGTPQDAANSTWWTFEDEISVRNRHWHFKPGEVVLDVGAAFGSYTITAAIQGARVYALEPGPCCRILLSENIAANPSITDLVTIVPIGAHSGKGFIDPENGNFSAESTSARCLEVQTVDEIVQSLGLEKLDLIKFDIEGIELLALQGSENTIQKFKPKFLIEEHEFKIPGIGQSCQSFLEKFGYIHERHPYHAIAHSLYTIP